MSAFSIALRAVVAEDWSPVTTESVVTLGSALSLINSSFSVGEGFDDGGFDDFDRP